jgi:hypothetical protein
MTTDDDQAVVAALEATVAAGTLRFSQRDGAGSFEYDGWLDIGHRVGEWVVRGRGRVPLLDVVVEDEFMYIRKHDQTQWRRLKDRLQCHGWEHGDPFGALRIVAFARHFRRAEGAAGGDLTFEGALGGPDLRQALKDNPSSTRRTTPAVAGGGEVPVAVTLDGAGRLATVTYPTLDTSAGESLTYRFGDYGSQRDVRPPERFKRTTAQLFAIWVAWTTARTVWVAKD